MMQSLDVTGTPAADSYLYQARSLQVEFVVIEEDMAQLNDFCVHFIDSAHLKVRSLETETRDGVGGEFLDPDGVRVSLSNEDVRDGAAMALEAWRDTSDFLARANCLILLACFTEKSLVWLCQQLGNGVPRARSGKSKVATCIEYLKEKCALSFHEPEASTVMREKCRQIRNAFAHGDWEDCRKQVKLVALPEAFDAVTGLLSSIEDAHEKSKPAE